MNRKLLSLKEYDGEECEGLYVRNVTSIGMNELVRTFREIALVMGYHPDTIRECLGGEDGE